MKKLTTAFRFIFLFTLTFLVTFQTNAQVSDTFDMLDVFDLEYVSDPQISPDGKKVIYVRNFSDIMTDRNLSNLWIADFDGAQHRPLTTGEHNDRSPRWSHDGQKIIYTSNKSGKSEIYLRWMDSTEEMVLVNSEKSPSSVTWSPDDKHLAFTMFVPKAKPSPIKMPAAPKGATWNAPPKYIDALGWRSDGIGELAGGNQQLFTVPVAGGTPRQLTDSPFDHGSAVWGKDGKSLYFSANMRADNE
ncbi:MAG: Tol biopolymer transport system component, partial [Cyclobacteriaceae bacterium]